MSNVNRCFTEEEKIEIIDFRGRGKTVGWLATEFKVHGYKISAVINEFSSSSKLDKWEGKTYNLKTIAEPKYYYDEHINEMEYGSDIRLYRWKELCLSEQLLTSSKEHKNLKKGYE